MPCSGGGPSKEQIDREIRDENTMTRLSCDRCKEIESRGSEVPDWAKEWWESHKRKDYEETLHSEKKRKEVEIRKRAINKLTPEERAELGV